MYQNLKNNDYYNKYLNYLNNLNNNEEVDKKFIADDIYKFILELIKKYKCEIGYNIITQLENEDEKTFIGFIFKIFDLLFDINNEDEIENINEENELYERDDEVFKSSYLNIFKELNDLKKKI